MECTTINARPPSDGGGPPPSNGGDGDGGIGQFIRDHPFVTATGVIGLGAVLAGTSGDEDGG